jgi:hypothetical protein
VIESGSSASILVTMSLKGFRGPVRKTILVESTDPNRSTFALHLQGTAVPDLTTPLITGEG